MMTTMKFVSMILMVLCAHWASGLSIPTDQVSDLQIPEISPCPQILCPAIYCENPIPTFTTFNGKRCQGCPRCPISCPIPLCAAIAPLCPNPITSFTIVNGQKCPGCPYCPVECPILNCLTVFCKKSQETFTTINGQRCPGCPRCDPSVLETI